MIIGPIDLGDSHPWKMPVTGQSIGELLIEGLETIVWPRGSLPKKQTVTFSVKSWQSLGGAAAFGLASTKYLLKQVEELASNREQQPAYIQWDATAMPGAALNAADLHDGWYVIDDFEPDYSNYVVTGLVSCRLTVTAVASAPPRLVAITHLGGSVPTDFSGTVKNLVAAPLNSTLLQGTALRSGAEGLIPYVGNPVNPAAVTLSATVADRFKGGVRVFDTLNSAAFAVPAGASSQILFHSIGSDSAGTLSAWTTAFGSPSIASNVVTLPAGGAAITAGHPDWWDCVYQQRFIASTGSTGDVYIRALSLLSNFSFVRVVVAAGGAPVLGILANNVAQTGDGVAIGSTAIVAGTAYWIKWIVSGTTYICEFHNDSAGAIGSLIASATVTVSSPVLATGPIGLQGSGGTGVQFGGAFASVCLVTGPGPAGWSTVINSGEPAFCWSQVNPDSGRFSLSVYNATAPTGGYWQTVTPTLAATAYTVSGRGRGTGTPIAFYAYFIGNPTPASPTTADGSWRTQNPATDTPGASATLICFGNGQGTYYFDNITVANLNGTLILGDGFEPDRSAMWVEVFDPQHNFTGDCVVTNGLLLYWMQVGRPDNGQLFLWNPALAVPGLQLIGGPLYYDNASTLGTLQSYSLVAVGPEESSIRLVSSNGSGSVAEVLVRLQRGRYGVRMRFKPKTQASTSPRGLSFSSSIGNPKIIYNPLSIGDPSRAQGLGGIPTDYGYAAGFVANANAPVVMGWLVPKKVTGNQGWSDGVAQIAPGDITSLPIDGEREYVFFAIPYGVSGLYSTANLQAEAEAGSLGTGWSSVNDGGTQAAKCASGTLISNTDDNLFGTGRQYAPGTYRVWFEVRVTSNASGVAQMAFAFYDETTPAVLVTGTIAPNAVATTYGWYSPGLVTITAGHTHHGYIQTAATLTTDWFINQVVLVPITELASNRDAESGPQDLWSQEMYDRTARMIRR